MRTSLPCETSAGLAGGGVRGRAPGTRHPRGDAGARRFRIADSPPGRV